MSIPAGGALKLADFVATQFGKTSAAGALLIGSAADLLITSRTFNTAASGTFGQYVPSFPATAALGAGQEARLIQLTKNSSYRTNLGLANLAGVTTEVTVELRRADGGVIGTRPVTLKPYSFHQEDDVIGKLTTASVDDAYAVIASSTAQAAYVAYASVIDNRTNDPICVVPAPALAAGEVAFVPAAARLAGVGGALWRTDLEVHNPGSTRATFTIELLERDRDNASPFPVSLALDGGRARRFDDVLRTLFDFTGAATLRITPTAGTVMVTSRTYNQRSTGTFGQFIPAQPLPTAAAGGQELRLLQLSQSDTTTAGFRTNLGLVNATTAPLTAEVELRRGDGALLGSKSYDLRPLEFVQVDRVFTTVAAQAVPDGFAVVRPVTPGGSVLAYASVIDNRSGDPVYIPGLRPGAGACEVTLTPTSATVGAAAASGSFAVAAGADCTWRASSASSWIQLAGGSTGTGPGTVSYTVAALSGTAPRTGSIVVNGRAFVITQDASAASEITVTLPGSVPLVLVRIPAGTFLMGSPDTERGRYSSEGPQHQVTLTQDYYMGKTEVTQRQWVAVMGSNPSYFSSCGLDCPVERVSWNDICVGTTGSSCTSTSFIGKVNTLLGTTKFRLPTEAEWERAARGGTTGPFSFDTSANPSWDVECGSFPQAEAYMWWCNNAGYTTHPVGQKLPNPYGLFDMHGNVDEWVGDWYGSYPSGAVTDPPGPTSGSYRVARGGGFGSYARSCRSATRSGYSPGFRSYDLGFRLARSQ